MARKLVVEVVADATQFLRSIKASSTATTSFSTDLKQLGVSSEVAAKAQVAAAVKTTESLRIQAVEYRRLAAAAAHGSEEQVAAARLAADAERKLAVSLGATAREATHLERGLGRATRGALTGSGAMRGFSRSLAFASGGFLAFEGVSRFLTDSINAARDAAVSQRSLAAQMRVSGESFDANRAKIEKAALSYGKFGFQNDAVVASLTVLERGTGKINEALRLQGLTADLARAKNIDLASAANVVAKVFGGQETALRRAVPGLPKMAHGIDLIREAQAKLAGQAAANTTASERFAATLHDTEEIVGTALLPTLNKYLTSLGGWLQRMNESGKLQKDVNQITAALGDTTRTIAAVFRTVDKVTGSFTNTLKTLALWWGVVKLRATAINWGLIRTEIEATGVAAETSAGQVRGLSGALGVLKGLGPQIGITVIIEAIVHKKEVDDFLKRHHLGFLTKSGAQDFKDLFGIGGGGGGGVKAITGGPAFRAFTEGIRQNALGAPTLPAKPLSLAGRFNLAELRLAQAQLTKTLADDRRILVVEKAIVEQQIAQAKSLKDRIQLTQQLAGIVGQIRGIDEQTAAAAKAQAEARKAAAQAAREAANLARANRQFRALGFGPGGADLVPGVAALQKRLSSVRDKIEGSFLDTRKTRSMLSHIRQVLSGGLGAVGEDVRVKIKEIFDGVDQQLKDRQARTRFRLVDPSSFVNQLGLGLTAGQKRRLELGLATVGPHGGVPALGPRDFTSIHIEHFHSSAANPRQLENDLTKRQKGRPKVRRGAR